MRAIGSTDLTVFPLCLGTNTYGWSSDRDEAFAVLDAYVAAGGNFIDTADVYPPPDNTRSEDYIGQWMEARGNRDRIVLATKVGLLPARMGLAPDTIRAGVDESLRRLRTDRIDLYYARRDDLETPLEDTLRAFDEVVRAGKVRYIAASNYAPERLEEALGISDREGLARFVLVQEGYSLVERASYEEGVREVAARHGIENAPHSALAKGFLSGKYRPGAVVDSVRAERAGAYLDERGRRVLAALDEIAAVHDAPVAAVSLAWLAAQPTVATPIAGARVPEQLPDLMAMATVRLGDDEIRRLADLTA